MNDETWKSLLRSSLRCLETLPATQRPLWTLGGGTVLMLRYGHRLSRDIDIFLPDPQYLTSLSPRLNDQVANLTSIYDEQSSFLKLRLGQGEIDFIIAPRLTDQAWESWTFENRELFRETPVEIAAKKAFYRAAELKVRDVFDLAFVLEREGLAVERNREVFLARREIIQARLALLRDQFPVLAREQIALLPAGEPMLDRAWEVAERWFRSG